MAKDIMTSGIEMSDVIKTTGFPVPEDLEGKTFAECVSGGGGGADLEANHASSVNVEEYTQPIEITPAEGKDGMKKVTLTLTNIPSGGDTTGFSVQCFSLAEGYITCVEFPRSTKVTAVTCGSIPILAGGVQKGYAVFETAVETDTKVSVVYDGDTYSYTYDDRDYQSHELTKENP